MELLAVQYYLMVTSTFVSLQTKTQRHRKAFFFFLTPGPAKPEPLQPPSSGMGGVRLDCFNVYCMYIQMYPGATWSNLEQPGGWS